MTVKPTSAGNGQYSAVVSNNDPIVTEKVSAKLGSQEVDKTMNSLIINIVPAVLSSIGSVRWMTGSPQSLPLKPGGHCEMISG